MLGEEEEAEECEFGGFTFEGLAVVAIGGDLVADGRFEPLDDVAMVEEIRLFLDAAVELSTRPRDSIGTDAMWEQAEDALKQALNHYGFDAAFGGARRDEEKSRAKERVYSFRNQFHQWDPKNQRPELWNLYNARVNKGESIRVFPLSNWTELDIWLYLLREEIPIVPLYYAKERPVVERDGVLIMVDDERLPLEPGEEPMTKRVRFRTLGCYPLTGAIESAAETIEDIVQEMLLATTSERQGRVIDFDAAASMEDKKKDGYF